MTSVSAGREYHNDPDQERDYRRVQCEAYSAFICVGFQIAGLLKDNEKIQSNPEVPPSEDDLEIKKIKKVTSSGRKPESLSSLHQEQLKGREKPSGKGGKEGGEGSTYVLFYF